MSPDSPEDTSGPGMEMDDVATPVDALLQQGRRTSSDRIKEMFVLANLSLINLILKMNPVSKEALLMEQQEKQAGNGGDSAWAAGASNGSRDGGICEIFPV